MSILDRSVDFYSRVLGMTETVREGNVTLLKSAEGSQIYLRSSKATVHPTSGLGLRAVAWTADSADDFKAVEQRLRALGAHRDTVNHEGFTVIEGVDPDGLVLVVVYPGPDDMARHSILTAVAAW
ncbi:VOC family protein [Streptomyces cellulosae]